MTTVNKNISCPEPTKIPNNCGLAGVFQPANDSACTEISWLKVIVAMSILEVKEHLVLKLIN